MLATLGKTAARALAQRLHNGKAAALTTPGPTITRTFAPISSRLLDEYVAFCGGDPRAYKGIVPPHFFPHWAMPVAAETIRGVPYPILRVLNAGCRMQMRVPLPRGEALQVRAQLASIDDDGKRAILTQRIVTETKSAKDALTTEIYAFVPLERSGDKKKGGDKPRIASDAREIAFFHLSNDAGLSFAKLTGDFNPIHWLPTYAKASGFRNVILHGFGTLARAYEGLNRGLFAGDVRKLKRLEAKFVRPLVLPHDVGVFVHGRDVFVGDAVDGPAYMTGRFATGEDA
jgi:hypothetical protein